MHDHIVHVHRDRAFLLDAVTEYFEGGWQAGEAGIVIAREHFRSDLIARVGIDRGLHLLDAERTLERFMVDGMPDWRRFSAVIGGLIAELRLRHAGVRAYGEMVDVLWQRGEKDAAIKLEQYWNDLGRLQTFSLFCAYHLDSLEECVSGSLERICAVHTHLIPARDHALLDDAVARATGEVLDKPLSGILLTMAARHNHATRMPVGQAALLWLKRNMPQTAEQVVKRIRERMSAEAA